MIRPKTKIRSDSGQAVVEYILILVVTVGITLGLILQFNKAFKVFADNYFGNYLSCLLETGELPSLGVDESESPGFCNDEFQEFSFLAGRPPLSDKNTNSSRTQLGQSRSNGDGNSATSRRRFRPKTRRGRQRSRGGSGGSKISSSRTGRTPNNKIISSNQSKKSSESDENSEGLSVGPIGAIKKGRQGQNFDDNYEQGRSVRVKWIRNPKKKSEEEENRRSSVKAKDQSDAKKTRIPLRAPPKEAPQLETADFDWTDYLRFIIIAGIIIALLMLLAGQAVQMGKSMD